MSAVLPDAFSADFGINKIQYFGINNIQYF